MGLVAGYLLLEWFSAEPWPWRCDDAAWFSGTRWTRAAFGRPSRARCVTPAAAERRPAPLGLCLRAPRWDRQRQGPRGSLEFRSFRVADAGALPRILRAICETRANSGETPPPLAQLNGRDGQSGIVGCGCNLGRQMLDDALAARALDFGRAHGVRLLLSLLSFARDNSRAPFVPRAQPTVV